MRGGTPTFELVPVDGLLLHEEIDGEAVGRLAEEIRRDGIVRDPIWVARGSRVILNGHHRYAALRRLGVARVPAWVFDYEDDEMVRLDRWNPGPPISKAQVVRRARAHRLFPPKTTRHRLGLELPERPTPLSALLGPAGEGDATEAPVSSGPRPVRAGRARPGG